MSDFEARRDPTRPVPPAFTKLKPQVDIMERRAKRKAAGGLAAHPVLFAKLNPAKRKGDRDGGAY